MDAATYAPLSHIDISINGQKQTSNSMGLAVFTFPNKAYGDYINLRIQIHNDNYTYTHRSWQDQRLATDVLTKDTIVIYIADSKLYEKERDQLFDSLFMFYYRNTIIPAWEQGNNEIAKEHSSEHSNWLNQFVQSNLFQDVQTMLIEIAGSINPLQMSFIDSNIRCKSEKALLHGDMRTCLSLARNQITENDVSEQNLQTIWYYLELLQAIKDSTDSYAEKYHQILYNNGYNKNSYAIINYITSIPAENSTKIKDLQTFMKDSCKDVFLNTILCRPHSFYISEENTEDVLAEILYKIELYKQYFPYNDTRLIWLHTQAAYFHLTLGDTLETYHQLDTALSQIYQLDIRDFNSKQDYLLYCIQAIPNMFILPAEEDSAYPITRKLINAHLDFAEQLYETDSSLACKLLYLYILKSSIAYADSSVIVERINLMEDLTRDLLPIIPHLMIPQHVANCQILLKNGIRRQISQDNLLQLFANYKEAIYNCEPLFPYFYEFGIDINFDTRIMCMAKQNTHLLNYLDQFTDELLQKKSVTLHQDSLILKGEYYNTEAERLYKYTLYQEAIPVYDQAINYYQKAIPNHEMCHIQILDAILQKGDAYMYSQQYEEAIQCFNTVIEKKTATNITNSP